MGKKNQERYQRETNTTDEGKGNKKITVKVNLELIILKQTRPSKTFHIHAQ